MAILRRFRRGIEAQILDPANLIAEGEVWYATDTKTLYVGDSGGNKNAIDVGSDPILEQVSKTYDGVSTGTRIDVTTEGDFAYEKGRWLWFKSDTTILKPVGLAVNGGLALTCRDGEGNEVDVEANKIYLASYESSGSDFFTLASGDNSGSPVTSGEIAWSDKYDGVINQIQDANGDIVNVNVGDRIYNCGGVTKVVTGGSQVEYDRTTPVEVTANDFDTTGNGGRKLVRLDDGTLVANANDGVSTNHFYKSTDGGLTWTQVCFLANFSGLEGALVTDGVNVVFTMGSGTIVRCWKFDPSTQANVDIATLNIGEIDSGQTSGQFSGHSLAIAENGDLHCAWASKNASYSNAFNIRYSKSTDDGVNWSTVTQVTTYNSVATGYVTPSIVINSLGDAVIVAHAELSGQHTIRVVFNGSPVNVTVYTGGTYAQANPCIDSLSDGTLIVAWHGRDAVDSTVENIRFSLSTTDGVSWSSMEKLTSGNSNPNQMPSITRDNADTVSILYYGFDGSFYRSRLIQGVSGLWGAVQTLTSGTPSRFGQSTCNNYRDFTKPLSLWDGGSVSFYGKWVDGSETGQTFPDIDDVTDVSEITSNVSGALLFQDGTTVNKRYTGFKSDKDLV